MKQTKRILTVTVRRTYDPDADTSWVGEYSRYPEGDYSIDRKHTQECPVNNPVPSEAKAKLQRILEYVWSIEKTIRNDSDNPYYWGMAEAQDILGELIDQSGECDCDESGYWSHGELQFFNTSGNYKGEPLADIINYTWQDYDRMESYGAGNWCFVGVRAEAEIQIGDSGQNITSGGLWGIESDSDKDYFVEVETEQLAELREILKGLGFGTRAISAAFKNVQHENE